MNTIEKELICSYVQWFLKSHSKINYINSKLICQCLLLNWPCQIISLSSQWQLLTRESRHALSKWRCIYGCQCVINTAIKTAPVLWEWRCVYGCQCVINTAIKTSTCVMRVTCIWLSMCHQHCNKNSTCVMRVTLCIRLSMCHQHCNINSNLCYESDVVYTVVNVSSTLQ